MGRRCRCSGSWREVFKNKDFEGGGSGNMMGRVNFFAIREG